MNGISKPFLFILFLLYSLSVRATVDLSFNAGDFYKAGGSLNDVAIEADGDLIFVGFFNRIKEVLQSFIVRTDADGNVDQSFSPVVSGSVSQVEIQPDGKILIAGSFKEVNGQSQQGIARLNADGTLDTGFTPNVSFTESKEVMVLDANDKILVAGSFTNINGVNQKHLARLNTDGSLDTNFTPTINDDVKSVVIQADGKLIIGGYFTTVDGEIRNKIARLNADGTLDSAFNPNAGTEFLRGIESLDVHSDGKILVAGNYTTIGGVATPPVALLNADGTVSSSFDAEITFLFGGEAKFLTNGKVLIGGTGIVLPFLAPVSGTLVRLNANGSLDNTYDPDIQWIINSFEFDASDNVILAGLFSELTDNSFSATAKIDVAGSVDTFNLGILERQTAHEVIFDMVLQADGKVVIGGDFSSIDGITRKNIARLNTDGTVDLSFNASTDDNVDSISIQDNGKILIAGNLEIVNGTAITNLARLNTDGSLDDNFTPNPNCIVRRVRAVSNGEILISGCFSQVAGQAQSNVALLNSNGSLVAGFKTDINVDSLVYALELQPNGKILLGGLFTLVNGVSRNNLARLNTDGTLDSIFAPSVDGTVFSIVNTLDGKINLAGGFSTISGSGRNSVAKLNSDGTLVSGFSPSVNLLVLTLAEQDDGKILVGGVITNVNGQSIDEIARINIDGSLDTTFDPMPNSAVDNILIQPDGKILIAGGFVRISGEDRSVIARVEKSLPPEVSISPSNIQQNEGDNGLTSFVYTLTRENDVEPAFSVDYEVTGIGVNPADADDFGGNFPTGSIAFTTNETNKQLVIKVASDFTVENNEQFKVTISNPSVGTIIDVSSTNGLIINDDTDDEDNDKIAEGGDNCPAIFNPDQTDTDNNEVGDACDEDDDGDTINDDDDNCRLDVNPNQLDTDSDLIGDECDDDDDNDGVENINDSDKLNPLICRDLDVDSCDDCAVGVDQFGPADDFDVTNDGLDTDTDGQCNLSDTDDDNDMVPDVIDNCPLTINTDQLDENGFMDDEGAGDACEKVPEELCVPIKAKNNSVVLICL